MSPAEALLAELLSGAASAALQLDAHSGARLLPLEGRSLRIHCTNPPQRVTLRVSGGQLEVVPGSENPTDATVKGQFSDLLALLRGGSPSQKLSVSGDPTVLRDFAQCFESYDPALPDPLRQLLTPLRDLADGSGASADHPAAAFAEQARGFIEVGLGSLRQAFDAALASRPETPRSSAAAPGEPGAGTDAATDAPSTTVLNERLTRLHGDLDALEGRLRALRDGQSPS
ncbi:MAG: SCP2 sterol-binding domain-containing protein [Pseudomonadota bacterium]